MTAEEEIARLRAENESLRDTVARLNMVGFGPVVVPAEGETHMPPTGYELAAEWKAKHDAASREAAEHLKRIDALEVMVAWAHGEISEGQACRLTGMVNVDAREALHDALTRTSRRWASWRASNPPSPGSVPST